jgi:hypothetical protein
MQSSFMYNNVTYKVTAMFKGLREEPSVNKLIQ